MGKEWRQETVSWQGVGSTILHPHRGLRPPLGTSPGAERRSRPPTLRPTPGPRQPQGGPCWG
jgi:hypothetical protein